MSKVQFKTLFKKSWLNHEDFKDWLLEDVDKEAREPIIFENHKWFYIKYLVIFANQKH